MKRKKNELRMKMNSGKERQTKWIEAMNAIIVMGNY